MAQPKRNNNGSKALEITMRDVLDALEESASYFGYQPGLDNMEILSIEAPGPDPYQQRSTPATVHPLSGPERSADIVDYLIRRESAA
ncbi:hypothetical protein [Thiohalophilus sp.]|uniref:hypothetical protein n=1 Tax=Thiohalophilus sp. TaxID=3028392 RepID=UPI002ACE07E9|nr:hypothetical protein [Thiohalophilus sp.]MDZ7802785.1 hypothetical protein [Thiohalophilus sp.]